MSKATVTVTIGGIRLRYWTAEDMKKEWHKLTPRATVQIDGELLTRSAPELRELALAIDDMATRLECS